MNLCVEGSILIHASIERIWDTLTNPVKIAQYMFESIVETDWKVGSPVTFSRDRLHPKAERRGKLIQDKGEILEFTQCKVLQFSYWSSQEGYPDLPENYSIITYTLRKDNDDNIELTYLREKIPLEFEQMNQARFLPGMLKEIKRIAEEE
jgi:uncharacterized protein YndB with AHSA1/START domain